MRHKSNEQAGSQGFGLPSPFARAAADQRFGVASRLTAARVFLSAGASRCGCSGGLQTNSGREASGLHFPKN